MNTFNRSPDLSSFDFFSEGLQKKYRFTTSAKDIEKKNRITDVYRNISQYVLILIVEHFVRQLKLYL